MNPGHSPSESISTAPDWGSEPALQARAQTHIPYYGSEPTPQALAQSLAGLHAQCESTHPVP